ncbi:hypothetical protein GCM10009839_27860 [Catenulispora yoronensis]|uniref:Uncharacterized protein n=1 Tax=Catenulispora yoronensis TaxID=450799 RepID=A0ABP5FJX3_9ACTN
MGDAGVPAQTRRQSKVVLDAILTAAFNDQVTLLHTGKSVKRPTVAKKTKRIITSEQYDPLPRRDQEVRPPWRAHAVARAD